MLVSSETELLGHPRLPACLERQRRETYQPGLKAQEIRITTRKRAESP